MDIHVSTTKLDGVLVVETDVFRDERGFFIEAYHRENYAAAGIDATFVQDNHSRSAKDVLRGLHYQDMTAPMGKLVRCVAGAILDVAVDLRAGSPTFGQWLGEELTADNFRQLWIPPGFGHAFLALTEGAEVYYKCSGLYAPPSEGTVAWNDPDIGIEWPVASPSISARDAAGMSLQQYLANPAFRYGA